MMPTQVMVAAAAEQEASRMISTAQQTMEPSISHVAQPQDERMNETLKELQDARQAMARKDAKINALRKDLESMREQLEARDKELRAVKNSRHTQPKQDKRRAELTIR